MVFDLEMIKGNYAALEARILQAKKIINRPLTSSEKNSVRPPLGRKPKRRLRPWF